MAREEEETIKTLEKSMEEAIKTLEKSMECHDREVCGITEDCDECPLYADKDMEYEAHKVLLEHFKQEPCEDASELIQEVKVEFMNEDVVRSTEKETEIDRAYARGWNNCQSEILSNISEVLLREHYKDAEPCEDAVSRQAVLDKAFEIKTGEYTSAMVIYAHDIRTLPSVTPTRKIGHWELEDCISRKSILNMYECLNSDAKVMAGQVVIDIKALPPVTPTRKIGHWKWELEDWNKWTCSECGFTKRTDVNVRLGYNYCPNCGAEMERE